MTYLKKEIIIDSNKYKLEYWKDETKNMELIKFYDMFYIEKNEQNKIRIIPIGKIISSLKEEERDKILNNGGYKKEIKKYTDIFCEVIKKISVNQN